MKLKNYLKNACLAGLISTFAYSNAEAISGKVTNLIDEPKSNVTVCYKGKCTATNSAGEFSLNLTSTRGEKNQNIEHNLTLQQDNPEFFLYNINGRKLTHTSINQEKKLPSGIYLIKHKTGNTAKQIILPGTYNIIIKSNNGFAAQLKKKSSLENILTISGSSFAKTNVPINNENDFVDVKVNEYMEYISQQSEREIRIMTEGNSDSLLNIPVKLSRHICNDGGFLFVEREGRRPAFSADSINIKMEDINMNSAGTDENGIFWHGSYYNLLDMDMALSYMRDSLKLSGTAPEMIGEFNRISDLKTACRSLVDKVHMTGYDSENGWYLGGYDKGEKWFKFMVVRKENIIYSCPFINLDGSDFRKSIYPSTPEAVFFDFLNKDTTDRKPYTLDYTCENFATDFKNNARSQNIPVFMVSVLPPTGNAAHAIDAILVGNDALNFNDWIFIEPQNDFTVAPCKTRSMPCSSEVYIDAPGMCEGFYSLITFKEGKYVSHAFDHYGFGINFPTVYTPTFDILSEIKEKVEPKMNYILRK